MEETTNPCVFKHDLLVVSKWVWELLAGDGTGAGGEVADAGAEEVQLD